MDRFTKNYEVNSAEQDGSCELEHCPTCGNELNLPSPEIQRKLGRISVSEQILKNKEPSSKGKINFEITTVARKAAYDANMVQKNRRLKSFRNNRQVVDAYNKANKLDS